MNRKPNEPNKGLDVDKFMKAVGISLAVLLVGMLVLASIARNNMMHRVDHPRPASAASPQ